MPTFYKRKRDSTRGQWTEEDLKNAANAVKNENMSIRQASKTYGVPWSTLKRRLESNCFEKTPLGPTSILGDTNENKLVKHIKKLQMFGFAPSRTEVRAMAYKLAEQLNIDHRFNQDSEKAGLDWFHLFLSRHPELSIRKSEGVSLARTQNMNQETVKKYFDLLQDILVKNDLLGKPGNIYNVDESGLQLNNKPGYVVAAKGSKSVPNITSGERGETISVIACCNGEGVFLPPACIFKGKNEKPEYKDGMPNGSVVFMSQKSAYVNSHIFFLWLKNHFYPRKAQGTVLLLLDGHSSHCQSVETLEFAEDNDIILLCLPSHTTHWLQPLDRSFFKPLKSYFYSACNNFLKLNPNRKLNRLVFGSLLNEAWGKAATQATGSSGFRAAGIIPFNPHIVPDYAFLSSDLPRTSVNQPESFNPVDAAKAPETVSSLPEEDNIGQVNETTPPRLAQKEYTPEPGCSTGLVRPQEPPISNKPSDITPGKLLDQISPVPIIRSVKKVRKNARTLATILNTKNSIQDLRTKKENQKQCRSTMEKQSTVKNKNKGKKRQISESSEEDDDDEPELDDDEDLTEDEDCCAGCGEQYNSTKKTVDWIRCILCNRWLHEDCTKYVNMCDLCGKVANKKKK